MTFEMVGRIDTCFLLSYAVDPVRAATLVPSGLELMTWRGVAFFNIVVCHVDRMRPRLSPRALGVSYWHIAYRLQVRATMANGKTLEGLYFLRSDVDRPLFGAIGNGLTDFRFHASRVRCITDEGGWSVRVDPTAGSATASVRVRRSDGHSLAPLALFASLEERERVLKYAPFGLSVNRSGRRVRIAEVRRDETLWREEPVQLEAADWSFPRTLGLHDIQLVRATRVVPIDYRWRLGRSERLAR